MITHLLFKGFNSFNIGSNMFRKILAIIVAVLIFSLVFLAVKFTKVEVPNFNRNLIMLAVVDISAFGLVIWKFGCPMEKRSEEKVESATKEKEKEMEPTSNKTKDASEDAEEDARDDVKEEDTKDKVEEKAREESK